MGDLLLQACCLLHIQASTCNGNQQGGILIQINVDVLDDCNSL